MAQLTTVQDYIDTARTLLQDTVNSPYRYSNADLVNALNLSFLEVRRLRPELVRAYFTTSLPSYSASSLTTTVAMDQQYRIALLYYICGHVQLRDDEVSQDQRAAIFMSKFSALMQTAGA